MKVVLGFGESLEDICHTASKKITIEFTDEDDPNKGQKEIMMVLQMCECNWHPDDDEDDEDWDEDDESDMAMHTIVGDANEKYKKN